MLLLCNIEMANWRSPLIRKGRDVPNKIIKVQDIPKQLAISSLLQVRGDVYIPNRTSKFSKRITSGFLWVKEGIRQDIGFCNFQIFNTRLNQPQAKKNLKKLFFSTTHYIFRDFTSPLQILRDKWAISKLFANYPTD